MLDFTTLEKSGGFIVEMNTENTSIGAYKSKGFIFQAVTPSFHELVKFSKAIS